MLTDLRQCFIAFVGGLGSALSVGANSCSAKGGQPREKALTPEGYRGALQLPPMYQVYVL